MNLITSARKSQAMDTTASILVLACVILASIFLLISNSRNRKSSKRLPPGPYHYPIIGNILQLGQNPHVSLFKLAKIYGPLMHLKLGQINTIVVSSPDIAKEILQKHEHYFPCRKSTSATQALDHDKVSVAWLPVGSQWRTLRKICQEQIFSAQRLEESKGLRHLEVQKLLTYVGECCRDGRVVDIGEAAFVTALNLISNTLISMDFSKYNTSSSHELKGIVRGVMKLLGSPNLADYFPILGLVDPQGIKRETKIYFRKFFDMFDDIIDQRVQSRENDLTKNDMLEVLLENLSRNDIKHLLLDLFVAGSNTTASTVEWAMTELLRNPDIMSKVRNELKAIIGEGKQIEESDITKLPFLQAVIKETFRYHPPGPFVVRQSENEEVEISTYALPKNSVILVNTWAIARDPSVWSNPESFEPQRFLNGEVDVKGQNFELLPFGAGRRICPALPLANRMVHLMVASLIHNFGWKLESEVTPEQVDVKEKFGLSLQKAVPLKAVPISMNI